MSRRAGCAMADHWTRNTMIDKSSSCPASNHVSDGSDRIAQEDPRRQSGEPGSKNAPAAEQPRTVEANKSPEVRLLRPAAAVEKSATGRRSRALPRSEA